MKITEEQIQKVNQVINSLPIAFLKQAQEIVSVLNESIPKEESNDKKEKQA